MHVKALLAGVVAGVFAATSAVAATTGSAATEVVVDWGSYAGHSADGATPSRYDPLNATASAPGDFFRMGIGSLALFSWGGSEIIGDSFVFETTWNCKDASPDDGYCDSYPERINVYAVSGDIADPARLQDDFVTPDLTPRAHHDLSGLIGSADVVLASTLGNAEAQDAGFTVDLADARSTLAGLGKGIFHILIEDTTASIGSVPRRSYDGFDIDAVSAKVAVMPLPGGVLLIGSAVLLMGAARRYLA
ncbi:MAG: hypothetical protein AAF192_22765 [Pseudomonadota bacterium]